MPISLTNFLKNGRGHNGDCKKVDFYGFCCQDCDYIPVINAQNILFKKKFPKWLTSYF